MAQNVYRRYREQAGMTQTQVAEKVGVHPSMINKIEKGTRVPTLTLAGLLADLYGCTTDDFRRAG